MKTMAKKPRKTPAQHPTGAGKGGIVPPLESRWQPGQSGNPAGRRNFGATVGEWYNAMAEYSEIELNRVIADKSAPRAKIVAARAVKAATTGDLPFIIEVCDRTDGSSVKRTAHTETHTLDPALMLDFAKLLLDLGAKSLPAELAQAAKKIESKVIE